MDSSSESDEDEVFFGPITEKEMMIRIQKGIIGDERSVENEDDFKSDHFSSGEQNICNSHSLAASISQVVNQVDISHVSDEAVYSKSPNQQKSEWPEGYYYDTWSQEYHISDQKGLCKPIFEEGNNKLTSNLESNYNQLDSVNGHENGHVSDNECLSVSITNAIIDGENEYGEFDNTLRSIEDLENSFTQVTLDGSESIDHSLSVPRETNIEPNSKNNFIPLTIPDESKNVCATVFERSKVTELCNNTSDVVVNDLCSLQLSNSVKVTDISNHSNRNEFVSNTVVSKTTETVDPVSSDSTFSFQTCKTNSDSTVVSTKTSESAFSEIQSSSSSNAHCLLVSVSDHEISKTTERNGIKLYTDNRNTSEVLFENLSENNSESLTDLEPCFDLNESSNKSENISSHTSDTSGSFTRDLNNRSFITTICEKIDKVCDLQTQNLIELKNNAEEMQTDENDVVNISGQTNVCNIENHVTGGNIYKGNTITVGSTEENVFNEVSQPNLVDITVMENGSYGTAMEVMEASRDETVYIFKTDETSKKEVESCELSFEIMQNLNNETPSEPNINGIESFEDLLDKSNDENTQEINVYEKNEHIATSTGSIILQSDCEINNEPTKSYLKIQNDPENIIFEPSKDESNLSSTRFSETYGTSSNEIFSAANIFSSLSEETVCTVDSYKDRCMSSDKNLMTESAYLSNNMTDIAINKCEGIYELKDNSLYISSVSSNEDLSSKGVHSSHGLVDSIKAFSENKQEENKNYDYLNELTPFRHVTSMQNENICEHEMEKSLQKENRLDCSGYIKMDGCVSNKTGSENYEKVRTNVEDSSAPDIVSEIEIKESTVIDDGISKQEEMDYEEEPMDISCGDLSIKNTEQWKEYRLTIDLDASLLGDIITETEFKEVLDTEEASFNIARNISKDENNCIPDADPALADNGSLQKSNMKTVLTNNASKFPKQQKSLIKTPLFRPKTDVFGVQGKWALNLMSTKPSTADKNTGAVKCTLSSQKAKLQKPSTAPKSLVPSICREPKSQSKLKQENNVICTAKRKIELIQPASSPSSLKKNERFKQVESPIRAYINSPSPVISKMSSHGNGNKSLLENKIPKQEVTKSTEKKVSHIPMLRTPRLQLTCTNISKRKADTTENVDPNRGSYKSTPRVKESPYSKLPRYNDKFKKTNSTPLSKPRKPSEKDTGSPVLQDKANYKLHDLPSSPNKDKDASGS